MNALIILSVVFSALTLWVTFLFVRRKNMTKVGSTEQRKAQVEQPESGELEDPLNPTEEN